MAYEPLAMRDINYVHTHMGAEGLCRAGTVGLDMQVRVAAPPILVEPHHHPHPH